MNKRYHRILWALAGLLIIVLWIISYLKIQSQPGDYQRMKQIKCHSIRHFTQDKLPDNKFFTRYIDTITLDTMYFICRLGPAGDTIPDLIDVTYGNDSVVSFRYYLNSQGDTVFLDYYNPLDETGLDDSLQHETDSIFKVAHDSIFNAEGQRLVEEITDYLDRISRSTSPDTIDIPDETLDEHFEDTIPTEWGTFNSIIVPDEPEIINP